MATQQEMQFAVMAVKRGLIAPQQVQECMDIQRQWHERGKTVQLLAIFLQRGVLSKEQIIELQQAMVQATLPKTVTLEQAKQIPNFKFLERIGEGGVATVFRAIDRRTDEEVAVKVLFPFHAANAVFVERFNSEGHFLMDLDHPNVVKGYEVGIWPEGGEALPPSQRLHYVSMELVRGSSIQNILNESGPLDEAKALHVIVQVAEALDYLRSRNCVHRDIKPDNILLDDGGNVKLVDLGFAKEIEEAGGNDDETENTTCGTVQYISPEQARGLKDVDIRADIYSLGATLYHLVIGEVPFSGKDSMEIMAAQVLNSLSSDKYRKRGLSHYTGYFIEKMMAKERDERYQTPREAIEDIHAICGGAAELVYNPDNDPMMRKFGGGSSGNLRKPAAAPTGKIGSKTTMLRKPLSSSNSGKTTGIVNRAKSAVPDANDANDDDAAKEESDRKESVSGTRKLIPRPLSQRRRLGR